MHDENGNLVSWTDGLANSWTTEYDMFDRQVKSTGPLGDAEEISFDKRGLATEARRRDSAGDLLQRVTRFYDERGRRWKASNRRADGATVLSDAVSVWSRNRRGQQVLMTDALGQTSSRSYDSYGQLEGIVSTGGSELSVHRDSNGNAVSWSVTEPAPSGSVSYEFEATFDVLDRRLTVVEIDRLDAARKLVTSLGYDSRSNQVWRVDPEGNPTRAVIDGLGRVVKREEALELGTTINDFVEARVAEWSYDGNGRTMSQSQDSQAASGWLYDALDRPTRMTYPGGSAIEIEYDAADRPVRVTKPSGTVIVNAFDAAGRMISRTVSRAAGVLGTTSESWSYDALGRIVSTQDDDYRVSFGYAVIGFDSIVTSETQEYVSASPRIRTVTKTPDALGRITAQDYPSGLSLTRAYDTAGNLSSISDGTNSIVSFTYTGPQWVTAQFQNGTRGARELSGFSSETAKISHQTSTSTPIAVREYGYSDRHLAVFERFGGPTSTGDAYAYDRLGRLTSAWLGSADVESPASSSYATQSAYEYDDDDNRVSVTTTEYGQAPSTASYTTNARNQYLSVSGAAHTWSDSGCLADDGALLYDYDYRGNLVRVRSKQGGNTLAEYRYDTLGRRVETSTPSGGIARFVHDNLDVIEVTDGTGVWRQRYVHGAQADEVIMLEQADVLDYDSDGNKAELTRSFYHLNALGSVVAISDMTEDVVAEYSYAPYGATVISVSGTPQAADPLGQAFGFTGRWIDAETGLYYYRSRHYSPKLGRFLQRDPTGLAAGPNLYAYVSNSPTNFVDPLGWERVTPYKPGKPKDLAQRTLGALRARGVPATALPSIQQIESAPLQGRQASTWEAIDLEFFGPSETHEQVIHCGRRPVTGVISECLCTEYKTTQTGRMRYRIMWKRMRGERPERDKDADLVELYKKIGAGLADPTTYIPVVGEIKTVATGADGDGVLYGAVPVWGEWAVIHFPPQFKVDSWTTERNTKVKCDAEAYKRGQVKVPGSAKREDPSDDLTECEAAGLGFTYLKRQGQAASKANGGTVIENGQPVK